MFDVLEVREKMEKVSAETLRGIVLCCVSTGHRDLAREELAKRSIIAQEPK